MTQTVVDRDLPVCAGGERLENFLVEVVYRGIGGRIAGYRLRHDSGCRLDYIPMNTAPQCFLTIETPPWSDAGEAHILEHLVLGKGRKGRRIARLDNMTLFRGSAFTMQRTTSFHYHCIAGPEVFLEQLEERLEAFLDPDFSREEARREVYYLAPVAGEDGRLRLEEKGTIHTEMVAAFSRAPARLWWALRQEMHGAEHPLGRAFGGWPEAVRRLEPEDLRAFHASRYRLDTMTLIVCLPPRVETRAALQRLDGTLTRLAALVEGRSIRAAPAAPVDGGTPPHPPGHIRLVPYPDADAARPSTVVFAWRPGREPTGEEDLLLELLWQALAGDATSLFHRRFVDQARRIVDTGATSIWASIDSNPGRSCTIGLSGVSVDWIAGDRLAELRDTLQEELRRVARWELDEEEAAALRCQVQARLVAIRRHMADFVNSPPCFGFRQTRRAWADHLEELCKLGRDEVSLLAEDDIEALERSLAETPPQDWFRLLADLDLVETAPRVVATEARPELLDREREAARERLERATRALCRQYGTDDAQEALARYRRDHEAATAALEAVGDVDEDLRFLDTPPLTLDPEIAPEELTLDETVPFVWTSFPGMVSASCSVAFDLNAPEEVDPVLLCLLPSLIEGVGLNERGERLSYAAVIERLRREILALGLGIDMGRQGDRFELIVNVAGNSRDELVTAGGWARRLLSSPDWSTANLSRLLEVVDQSIQGFRDRTSRNEETWAANLAGTYRLQDRPRVMALANHLCREFLAQRLRWRLTPVAAVHREAVMGLIDGLAGLEDREAMAACARHLAGAATDLAAAGVPPALIRLLGELPEEVAEHLEGACRTLEARLQDLAPDRLGADWREVLQVMGRELLTPVETTLAGLHRLRRAVLAAPVRGYGVGDGDARAVVVATATRLIKPYGPAVRGTGSRPRRGDRLVDRRLAARGVTPPWTHVAFLLPSAGGGVIVTGARGPSYREGGTETWLDHLAFLLYGGSGDHGVFMQTWGAGLAYSNGLRIDLRQGRIGYYAERCPAIEDTLRFVADILRRARVERSMIEYAIALAFGASRASSSYEARASGYARDLADGLPPSRVAAYRRGLLALRRRDDLVERLAERLVEVTGRVVPGLGRPSAAAPEGLFFAIGRPDHLDAYEAYLQAVEGPEAGTLVRLYPRDFWLLDGV